MGELTASIAHEVSQPLTGIVANGEAGLRWLKASPPNIGEVTASVSRIIGDGRRAAAIIARIGALVRKAEPEKCPLDLNEAILDIIPLVDSQIARARADLRLDLAADLTPILGDRVQIQQVLLNLMKNAIEAMAGAEDAPRTLWVSTARKGGRIEIAIRDTGSGLPADAAGAVFDAFFSTKDQGMGMGLAISRAIVESHGGTISAEPAAPRGTVFRIDLPASV